MDTYERFAWRLPMAVYQTFFSVIVVLKMAAGWSAM
tara:strand:- start:30 stop:137 length:108 start_codon:yes stop_codon:yes gene_type:complete